MEIDKDLCKNEDCDAVSVGFMHFMWNLYRSYRNWRKTKGRRAKSKKRLHRMVKFYSQFIKPRDLCFDIGANMGDRTEAFVKLDSRVVAVEPQNKCLEALQERFHNNLNLILVSKALAETEGEKQFFISNAHTLSSCSSAWIEHAKELTTFEGCNWDQRTTVPTTTLDALIETYGKPAFCKIDVEGFEYEVLRGLSQPVHVISLEYTIGIIEPTIQCIKHLSKLGKVEFNYSEGESMSLALSSWVTADEILEILTNMPEGKGVFGDVYIKFCKDSP